MNTNSELWGSIMSHQVNVIYDGEFQFNCDHLTVSILQYGSVVLALIILSKSV